MTEYDAVDKPAHYAEGRKYEPIDVFMDWDLGPLEWQVCKYLSRLGRKGDALEDAKKAQFYMNRLVQELEDKADVHAAAEARKEPRVMTDWSGEYVSPFTVKEDGAITIDTGLERGHSGEKEGKPREGTYEFFVRPEDMTFDSNGDVIYIKGKSYE